MKKGTSLTSEIIGTWKMFKVPLGLMAVVFSLSVYTIVQLNGYAKK